MSALKEFVQANKAGRKGGADMSPLVAATSQLALAQMDVWERCLRQECDMARTPLTWLDLCSGDGFIREKALNALSGPAPNRFFLALALRRLNDWVPEVRASARKKLPLMANDSEPEQVVDVLCATLPHLHSWGRMEEADKQVLLALTSLTKVLPILISRLITQNTGPMTAILTQTCRTSALDRDLSEIAHRAIQPALRAKAYRFQLECKAVWFEGRKWEWTDLSKCKGHFQPIRFERPLSVEIPFLDSLKLAAADPSPLVRRVAGEMLIRSFTLPNTLSGATRVTVAVARLLAERLASDTAAYVAEQGQFVLKRLEPVDISSPL